MTNSASISQTFYDLAHDEMQRLIAGYLALMEKSRSLTDLRAEHLGTEDLRTIVVAGIGSALDPSAASPEDVVTEWAHMKAVPFDTETAITTGVYRSLRTYGRALLDKVEEDTGGFEHFTAEYVSSNPNLLPIFQHLGGLFSKAALKRRIGSLSDKSISPVPAGRLAEVLNQRRLRETANKGEILQRLESTLEGIVRDLVGRVLLETVVSNALRDRALPFQREGEYDALEGVVYDFRADFVLPNAVSPLAFIEVRKSSTRHASLYAKDKMFSAINWKGRNQALLGVLVTDGPWTRGYTEGFGKSI